MTLDTIIYETIPVTYTANGANATTNLTIDMVADRSLADGLYLIKFVGGSSIGNDVTTSSSANLNATFIKLYKDNNLISHIHPTNLTRSEWNGTVFISNPTVISPHSFTYILTNSVAKPIKLNYVANRYTTAYFNTTGTFIFQKLRDLNAGEE